MNYYRKNVDNTANDLKLKMQMAAFTLKLSENNDKIDDLLKADKDIKKDIIDNSNAIKNFYTKQDINNIISQYYLKKYLYDKTYIDTNFLVKSEIDKKDNEILNKVNDYIQEIKNNYHSEVNDKTSKLDRNIILFNQNLTKFIDETYKEDQKL